ncbi:hypothetical protein DPEC_G00088930 [Dallia pectoralis]|uniref:Uncharacterized protein n=1 Tax=Dallia pectoralis TaxID=75939 RepID=A0ACC2H0H5_DALPE|nr:hypothetical protein DPEC_G00088930 [Dallia pectoralis]
MSVIVAVILCRKRSNDQITAVGSSTQPADSITYSTIKDVKPNPRHIVIFHGEDTAAYASIMTSTDRRRKTENPADPYYSTVNHPHRVKP